MRSASFALLALALAACGPKSKPVQLAPLPDDKPAVAKPAEPVKPAEPIVPDEPAGPVEAKLPGNQVSVKLVSKGAGKLAPLRYTAKPGAKQKVELAMDFASLETCLSVGPTCPLGTEKKDTIIPTIVLLGEAETKVVDKDGKAEYAVTVSGVDAREVKGSELPVEKFKLVLGSLGGLVIGGTVGADGKAGETTLTVAKPDQFSEGALELVRLTMPAWPVLPAEPIGVGAKWQATVTTKLADKVMVTQVTDYELVSHKGAAWSIKSKTKISGVDQEVAESPASAMKISKISGSGTSEVTLNDGALYPTYKSTLQTQFTATETAKKPDGAKPPSLQFDLKVGGTITTK